jgi:hypothetical protein
MDLFRTNPNRRRPDPWVVALVVLVAVSVTLACSSERTDPVASGGWLNGSPAEADAAHAAGDELAEVSSFDAAGDAVGGGAVDDVARAEVAGEPGDVPGVAPGLRAGSVDDNVDFAGYLDYRDRFAALGIPVRELDVSVRHVVSVVGDDGRPVLGEPIEVLADGVSIGTVRTGADGTAYVHPRAMGASEGAIIEVVVGGSTLRPSPEAATVVEIDRAGGADAPVPLDLFFLLDATGSMGDELNRLTNTIDQVVDRIAGLDSRPDVRLGMTVYRDEGDAFVTRTFDFTDDVAGFREALGEVEAAGGGDIPEALDEALAAGLAEPSWREPADTVQLAFVVADAPPQVERDVPTPYDVALLDVAARGIKLHAVGATGTDDAAEYVFRQFAQFSGGRFVFLSHGVEGAALGPSTDIAAVDYEELPLEDLLVRLVSEELDHLAEPGAPAPSTSTTAPPSAPTTTIDPAQRQPG